MKNLLNIWVKNQKKLFTSSIKFKKKNKVLKDYCAI